MLLEKNPITEKLHDDWRQRIRLEFPEVVFPENAEYLSLINYLDNAPQKFYSKLAFISYWRILNFLKQQDEKLLSEILKEIEALISISNKNLAEINKRNIHDIILPEDSNDLIDFIEVEIHPNLLKLYETPLFYYASIVTNFVWIKEGKQGNVPNVQKVMEKLKDSGFTILSEIYFPNIRNGIAHGKIIYKDVSIEYIDKKETVVIDTKEIVSIFDKTLDLVNGFSLAFKIFCFCNSDFFNGQKIPIPQSILKEELEFKANAPLWKIRNSLDSITMDDRKQLIIYIKNEYKHQNNIRWHSFTTAYWAERLTKKYDRIFLRLESEQSLNGWAIFDAKKLRGLREKGEEDLNAYSDVLEGDINFKASSFKTPRVISKMKIFLIIFKQNFHIYFRKDRIFSVRDVKMHRRGGSIIIQDASVIIHPKYQQMGEDVVKKKYKEIVEEIIKYSRRKNRIFSVKRYLPRKRMRIFIYDSDKRIRNLRNGGLPPELIATIELGQGRIIDINDGAPKQLGKYRIVWYQKWRGKAQRSLTSHKP
jgi:hypothetical protein